MLKIPLKIRMLVILCILPVCSRAAFNPVQEQPPQDVAILESRCSTTTPIVGETFTYFLKFDYKEGLNVAPFEHLSEQGFTIVDAKHLAPQTFAGRVIQQYEYTVTPSVAGQFEFVPASIQYVGPLRNPIAAEAEPIQMTVTGIVDIQVVTNSPILLGESLELRVKVTKRQPVTISAMPPQLQADFQVPPPSQERPANAAGTPLPAQTPPPPPPALQFELDPAQQITPQQVEGATVEEYRYIVRVAPEQTGEYVIPEFTVTYRTATGAEQQISAPTTSIFVLNPNTANLDITTDYRFLMLPAIVLAAMLLAGLGAFLFLKYRKPRQAKQLVEAPPLPPGEIARRELAEIQAMKLPAKGEFKTYYTLLSETIRKFLGAEFGFPVIERTTEEVVADLQRRNVPEQVKTQTVRFLQEADLVKFAKYIPLLEEAETAMNQAFVIVEASLAVTEPKSEIG